MSAFAGSCGIIPGHEEAEEKSNEIPAARKLIEELGLSDRIFTFDALHCQKKTLRAAVGTGNDVIVQVKENQKTLLNDCKIVADTSVPDDIYTEPVEKTRNRKRAAERKFSSLRRLRTRKNGVRSKLSLKLIASVRCSIQRIKSGKTLMNPPSMFQRRS